MDRPRQLLHEAIREEAQKLIRRHERYAKDLHDEFLRRNRRAGTNNVKQVLRPSYWEVDPGFNPYIVRSRFERIAYSVKRSLRARQYHPRAAIGYTVAKGDGTNRTVSVFQIADAAVSKLVFKSLLQKNRARLSSYSFAYRSDLTVHDAIRYIAAEMRGKDRVFVAEYDFRTYFDSVNHDHVWRILREQGFLMTDVEQRVIHEFLTTPTVLESDYKRPNAKRREQGLPQGTSLSLFLANVAAWPLDRSLERLGVGFARYADDTLIWSSDYGSLCRAVEALAETGRAIGASVNFAKSHGISILSPELAPVEFKAKKAVEFVGYSFSSNAIAIRDSALRRIKARIAGLVYQNLLEQPKRGNFVPSRFAPPVDRDYVVMIYQLRRYLYGNLSERKLRMQLNRVVPRVHYKGVMAFYPLVDAPGFLEALDGWLVHLVWTTQRRRGVLLRAAGYQNLPDPFGLSKDKMINFRGYTSQGEKLDLRLPSFARMAKLLTRAARTHGANAIGHTLSNQYYVLA